MLYFLLLIVGLLGFCLIFLGFYFSFTYVLKIIPSNWSYQPQNQGIMIWVLSNGAHTDICMPLKTDEVDWEDFMDLSVFQDNQAKWISIGWGDKGFYLDTPSWAELKFSVAFKALFKLSQSCMQVILYEEIPKNYKWYSQIYLSKSQYQKLVNYIQKSFEKDARGHIIHIPFGGMPAYDHLNYNFYEGEGQYHLFKTCNCWANNTLKTAGVKTATWTPFAKSVFYHLPKIELKPDNELLTKV